VGVGVGVSVGVGDGVSVGVDIPVGVDALVGVAARYQFCLGRASLKTNGQVLSGVDSCCLPVLGRGYTILVLP
jgi:hypothetical protein